VAIHVAIGLVIGCVRSPSGARGMAIRFQG
jgi:hypothetical protein